MQLKRKGSHDGLPTAARPQAGAGPASLLTTRSIALTAALFVAAFTVLSVSRLNRGTMPDTRASRGGDGAADLAAHADAAAAAAATAAVPLPAESADSLKDHHRHAPPLLRAEPRDGDGGAPQGLFALTANDVRGNPVALSKYGGSNKAVLVVNTASACGYTRANFEGLVATRRKYGPHGFEVLSFPSNSFRQEPLDGPELERWARDTHGAEFPVFAKGPVVGPDAQPVWRWIREQQQAKAGGGKQGGGDVKDVVTWNFWKFLVDGRTGQVVRAYGMPYSAPEIEHDVYALLNGGADGGEGGGGGKDAGGDTGATAEKERTAGAAAD